MKHLSCNVKFRVYEPLKESRTDCPYILVTICGKHPHPIPLPQKTPPTIRQDIMRLLESIGEDLPDLTPRRFLRHPILKEYLQQHFPNAQPPPTLSDLHVSLANRHHLYVYIENAKKTHFPAGTGWEGTFYLLARHYYAQKTLSGLMLLKKAQDESLPVHLHYIRSMIHLTNVPVYNEDDPVTDGDGSNVYIVICMANEGSWRLREAQYIQSDMAFKCVVGFFEFEMATIDHINNTSMFKFCHLFVLNLYLMDLGSAGITFCCVYVTWQTAAAHQRIFQEIDDIVLADTGMHL